MCAALRNAPAARMFPQETSAANAVSLYSLTRENGVQESPQTFLYPKIKNILSAEHG